MNDDEKEVLKAGAEAAIKPFTSLIEKLFGGAVEQIGGTWADALAFRRKIRQIELLKKLKAAIDDAGFEPKQIPDNIWIPALQEASLTDDESLQEKWANLLANAADPRGISPVLPSFSSILKEFTSREARFLDSLYDISKALPDIRKLTKHDIMTVYSDAGLSRRERLSPLTVGDVKEGGADLQNDLKDIAASIDTLIRNRVLQESETLAPIDLSHVASELEKGRVPRSLRTVSTTQYQVSVLGEQFVEACRAPISDA